MRRSSWKAGVPLAALVVALLAGPLVRADGGGSTASSPVEMTPNGPVQYIVDDPDPVGGGLWVGKRVLDRDRPEPTTPYADAAMAWLRQVVCLRPGAPAAVCAGPARAAQFSGSSGLRSRSTRR